MMAMEATRTKTNNGVGEPIWELAELFPYQGDWSEEEYLALHTSRLIEFTDGRLEILSMPTLLHQLIVAFLYNALKNAVEPKGLGRVLFAPLRVRMRPKKYREPDVVYLSAERLQRVKGDYPDGADLVMEVVSGSDEDRERDLITKRQDYAQAGVAEYWMVDPGEKAITVLRLEGNVYVEHGRFTPGMAATSVLLAGFSVNVAEALTPPA
jgi:Uma2 family endonuclease